jgi:hypothetical protein
MQKKHNRMYAQAAKQVWRSNKPGASHVVGCIRMCVGTHRQNTTSFKQQYKFDDSNSHTAESTPRMLCTAYSRVDVTQNLEQQCLYFPALQRIQQSQLAGRLIDMAEDVQVPGITMFSTSRHSCIPDDSTYIERMGHAFDDSTQYRCCFSGERLTESASFFTQVPKLTCTQKWLHDKP